MEKFTQKNYEELRAILSELHMHPGITIYKDAAENEILVKLYNWFNNNTYGFIEHIASEDSLVENLFYKIYLLVGKIRDEFFTQSEYVLTLKRLSEYYDRIENTAKTFRLNADDRDKTIKETFDEFFNYVNLSKKNIDDSILKFNKTIDKYNDQMVSSSKDVNSCKRKALADIEEARINFEHTVDTHNKEIKTIKQILIKQYDDLKKDHENFKVKIYQDLNDIQNAVNREQLAAYFLNERKKLKGDINIAYLFFVLLVSIFFMNKLGIKFSDISNIKSIDDILNIDLFMDLGLSAFIYLCVFFIIYFVYALCRNKFVKNNTKLECFQELKNLLTPYWCWLGLTLIGMLTILRISYILFILNLQNLLPTEPYKILANLPFFMILVWFTWFCSKQFSYTKQICDEYEYKYALSKSYLSYRDEARKASDNDKNKYDVIIISLLDSVIKNIATSPVKSVKPDCHTPFTEIFGSLKDVMKHTENKE